MAERTIAILGATGDQGYGLALRWTKAGEKVIIGSRAAERAEAAAAKILETLGGTGDISGKANPDAVAAADLVIISVPFSGQADTLKSVKDSFREGQIVCDLTVPLASAIGMPATRMIAVPHGSAAEQAASLVPKGVKVVSAFHNVAADNLNDLEGTIDCDVIVCGDNTAKPLIKELIAHLPGCRYVDGGPIWNSRTVEAITALLIGFNIRYKLHGGGSGIRITGIPQE